MFKKFILWLFRPEWVVFTATDESQPELGLKIWGVVFALYKAGVLAYARADITTMRKPAKREFGECLHPQQDAVLPFSTSALTHSW